MNIEVTFKEGQRVAITTRKYSQSDYGQTLVINGLSLPETLWAYFSTQKSGGIALRAEATTTNGVTTVDIPDDAFYNDAIMWDFNIYVHLFVCDDDSGRTEYIVIIPVEACADFGAAVSPTKHKQLEDDVAALEKQVSSLTNQIDDVEAEVKEYTDNKIVDLKAQGVQQTPLYPQGTTVEEQLEWLAENGDTAKVYVLKDGYIYGYEKMLIQGGTDYTNLVPTSTDTDGSIYNNTGYKDNTRLSSSGGVSGTAQTGSVTTGFIPYTPHDAIRIKGATWLGTSGHYYVNFYDSNKTFIRGLSRDSVDGGTVAILVEVTYDETSGVTLFDFSNGSGDWFTDIANASYMRINAYGKGADLIVTIKEEIKESATTETYQWISTGRAFVPTDYEDRIVELENNSAKQDKNINQLKEQVESIIDGSTDIVASTKFDPTSYRLPILYLTGDTTGMSKDVKVTLEYKYGDLTGTCTCKWQGATSTYWDKKNYTIVFDNPFEFKDGWGEQKKYCFKANWIDHSHARNIVSCRLWGLSVKSRSTVPTELANLPNGGAIDGYPCIIMLNGEFHGLYTWNIPKDGWMFGLVEDTTKQQAIVGANQHTTATQFKGEVVGDESDFELEFVSDENNTSWVNESLNRLINACIASDGTDLDTTVAQYLDWDSAIDYYIHVVVEKGTDAVDKNFLLVTFDGVKWYFSNYDRDTTYGLAWDASALSRPVSDISFDVCANTNKVFELIKCFKTNALKTRYQELRSNILSESRICQYFENFAWDISTPILLEDVKKWTSIRGSSVNGIDQICRWIRQRLETCDKWINEL